MYHLTKKGEQFYVVNVGLNGEVLDTSQLFPTKQNAFKNVMAKVKAAGQDTCFFHYCQDDTVKFPLLWKVSSTGKTGGWISDTPKYIPGKNKKSKK